VDRRRAHRILTQRPALRRALLGALAGATLLLAAGAAGADPPVRAAQWVAAGRDVVRALTTEPTECLARPASPDAAYEVELGRAAFRHPLLLGNQGARAGLTCESCHRGGRGNPDFSFPGLSGGAGTADVTSSVTSEHRGDGVFNPKPIPSLIRPPAQRIVSRDPRRPDLRNFIHGLVTEEFDGPEPPPAVLEGLAAYVRALSPAHCPKASRRPVTLAVRMDDARRALAAARAAAARRDTASAKVMTAAARSELGVVAERYEGPALAGDLAAIGAAAVDLGKLQARPVLAPADFAGWEARLSALQARLAQHEAQSLFDPRRLAARLKAAGA
jgi:hypothetical protein